MNIEARQIAGKPWAVEVWEREPSAFAGRIGLMLFTTEDEAKHYAWVNESDDDWDGYCVIRPSRIGDREIA